MIAARDIPDSWRIARVDQVADVAARIGWKALTANEYVDNGYAFLSTPNIKAKEIDFKNVNCISEFRYEESPDLKLETGDVLLAKDGNTLGITNIVRDLPRSATVNGSIARIRPTGIDGGFLRYVLESTPIQATIDMLRTGMGVPHLFQWDINRIPVPLPSEAEQHRIAAFLDVETERIDQLVVTKTRMIDAVASRLGAVRHELFAASSARVPLRRLITRLTSGPRGWANYVAHEGLPFLRITNVQRSSCVLSDEDLLYVNPPEGSEADRTRALVGDVVISITADIGSVGVVDDRFAGGFASQHLALLTPSPTTDPEWLANAIMSPDCQHELRASQYGGTKTQLSLEDVTELTVPAVDGATQHRQLERIRSESARAAELLSALDAQVKLLAERRRSLITAAITGEMSIA